MAKRSVNALWAIVHQSGHASIQIYDPQAARQGEGRDRGRLAQTCILGGLRHQRFFSLAEANAANAGALDRINDHCFRRLGVTRQSILDAG